MPNRFLNIRDRFFQFIELNYDRLSTQINDWLSSEYDKSGIQFNESSPYGQILTVEKELFMHNILYLKQVVDQFNIEDIEDERMLRYLSRIAGHNQSRAISASGALKFKLKGSVDPFEELNSSDPRIIITNEAILKNNTNSLEYSINLGNIDQQTYSISPGTEFYLNVLQGIWEEQTFTPQGTINESFVVVTNNNDNVDQNNFRVFYGGRQLKVVEHFYDMLPNEFACVAKTGFNGGLEIYLGNGDNGFIAQTGSVITVRYLLTNGVAGEILNPIDNDWTFETDIKTDLGESVDMLDLFDISTEVDFNFSSNGETFEQTKRIVPRVSRNFVLATPDQFKYHLLKLNVFSQVDAYNKLDDNDFSIMGTNQEMNNIIKRLRKGINEGLNKNDLLNMTTKIESRWKNSIYGSNDNIIYLFLVPKISKYLSSSVNYFNLPKDAFYLDDYEKEKTLNYLKAQGILGMTTEVKIIQPKLSRYICNVNIQRYEDTVEDNVRHQVIDVLSEYFIENERTDRVVKSDIIKELKNQIEGIDSVDVFFISEKNEKYHKMATEGQIDEDEYNENEIKGIDPILGDIVLNKDEYPLIRGGWSDRNGVYFGESPNYKGFSSININFGKIIQK